MVSLASLCMCRSSQTHEYPFLIIFISCFCCWNAWFSNFWLYSCISNLWGTLLFFLLLTCVIVASLCYKTARPIIAGRMVWLKCWITATKTFLTLGRLFCIPAQLAMCLMLTSVVCLASNPVRNAWTFVIFCSLYFFDWYCHELRIWTLPLMQSFIFFIFAGEWLDLDEHDYKIFGSQFS